MSQGIHGFESHPCRLLPVETEADSVDQGSADGPASTIFLPPEQEPPPMTTPGPSTPLTDPELESRRRAFDAVF